LRRNLRPTVAGGSGLPLAGTRSTRARWATCSVSSRTRRPTSSAATGTSPGWGRTHADVETREQAVAVLAGHPRLLQRPVLVQGDPAIVGRPKERVAAFLAD